MRFGHQVHAWNGLRRSFFQRFRKTVLYRTKVQKRLDLTSRNSTIFLRRRLCAYVLEPGDSIYFDSRMGHAIVSLTEEDARDPLADLFSKTTLVATRQASNYHPYMTERPTA